MEPKKRLPYFRPNQSDDRATSEAVAGAEKALNVRLPSAYVDLVQNERNGGYLYKGRIWSPELTSSMPVMRDLFGVGGDGGIENGQWLMDAWGLTPQQEDSMIFNSTDAVIFAADGHDHWLLDYQGDPRSEPRVVYANIDGLVETVQVASDYGKFLDRLEVFGESTPTWATDAVVTEFEQALDPLNAAGFQHETYDRSNPPNQLLLTSPGLDYPMELIGCESPITKTVARYIDDIGFLIQFDGRSSPIDEQVVLALDELGDRIFE